MKDKSAQQSAQKRPASPTICRQAAQRGGRIRSSMPEAAVRKYEPKPSVIAPPMRAPYRMAAAWLYASHGAG